MPIRISKPEIAILTGILTVVIFTVWPTIWAIRLRKRVTETRQSIERLIDAGRQFNKEYGIWPTLRMQPSGDFRFGQEIPNLEVIHTLQAVDGIGNERHRTNPGRIVFFKAESHRFGRSGLSPDGDFLDPWGTPYQIVLDIDLNGLCDIDNSIYGRGIGQGMVVWSCGPDRKSDTPDDVLSWKP